jgi:hypothetical protein
MAKTLNVKKKNLAMTLKTVFFLSSLYHLLFGGD